MQCVPIICNYLNKIPTDQDIKKPLEMMCNSITIILRNTINEKESLFLFLDNKIIEKLV